MFNIWITVHAKKIIYLFHFKYLCAIHFFSLLQQIETYSVNQEYNSLSDTESCWHKLAQQPLNFLFFQDKLAVLSKENREEEKKRKAITSKWLLPDSP